VNPDTALPAVESIASPPPSLLRKIFVGKDGLRAIWSVLIFICIFAALVAAAMFIGRKFFPSSQPSKGMSELSLKFAFANESIFAFAALLATWIMSKIERRGRTYGYGGAQKLSHFLAGLISGAILISLLILVLWKGGLLVIDSRLIYGGAAFRYGFLWLLAFCLVGLFEESLTRGFLLYTLTRGLTRFYDWAFKTRYSAALGFWTSAVILSLIFFLGHTNNPGESPVGLLSVFLAGMFFCFSIWWTGSLWWAVGMHAAWDWGQSFLFGVADSGFMAQHRFLATHPQGRPIFSGGATGPEGSIFIVGVLAVGCLIVVLTLPKGRYAAELDRPDERHTPAVLPA